MVPHLENLMRGDKGVVEKYHGVDEGNAHEKGPPTIEPFPHSQD